MKVATRCQWLGQQCGSLPRSLVVLAHLVPELLSVQLAEVFLPEQVRDFRSKAQAESPNHDREGVHREDVKICRRALQNVSPTASLHLLRAASAVDLWDLGAPGGIVVAGVHIQGRPGQDDHEGQSLRQGSAFGPSESCNP
eukprot:scaffold387_cov244-Pinguiococcus_pyrenoidosus.AAC.12